MNTIAELISQTLNILKTENTIEHNEINLLNDNRPYSINKNLKGIASLKCALEQIIN